MKQLLAPVEEVCSAFLREVDARLPGRLDALLLHGSLCWGEFFPGSDIDFVAVWDEVPDGSELGNLRAAHEATRAAHPCRDFDGFHCTAADLVRPPAVLGPRPVFFHGSFDPAGSSDLNLVTWHELAERGVVVRGSVPSVYTEVEELVRFTRENLDTYWRGQLRQVVDAGVEVSAPTTQRWPGWCWARPASTMCWRDAPSRRRVVPDATSWTPSTPGGTGSRRKHSGSGSTPISQACTTTRGVAAKTSATCWRGSSTTRSGQGFRRRGRSRG